MTWLKLNVGGHLIETQMSTLTKFPDSQLARQISSLQTPSSMDDDEDMKDANLATTTAVLNIDCDPDYFKIVLTWLRYGVISIPDACSKDILIEVAKQFGLHALVELLQPTTDKTDNVKHPMADWLKLNVGGTIFETSRSTLTSDNDSILSRMFEPNSNLPPATTTTDGVYQIDSCPRSFEVVLNFLRYRHLILGDAKVDDVLPVADYFGLGDLREMLESHKEKEEEEKSKMICCIEESVEKLEEVLQHIECEVNTINEKLEEFKIEMSSVSTGMDDLWRIKCELSNISGILGNQQSKR